MSNRYEQSLKEQAARIRRELAGEKETSPVERPKKEEREDRFVLTDVPSPIYGFQRPKQQRSIQEDVTSVESEVNVSSESEQGKIDESLENMTDETIEASGIETMEQTDLTEADAGLVPVTDSELLTPDPSIERANEEEASNSTVDFELVEDGIVEAVEETGESLLETTVAEENSPVSEPVSEPLTEQTLPTSVDEVAPLENELPPTLEEQRPQLDTEVTPNENVQEASNAVKKPAGPPVNVVMTTKDLMAMYRARREQNNLHGKK